MRMRAITLRDWLVTKMKERKKRRKENTRKFLSGEIDFGILGKRQACLFRNDNKTKDNHPAFLLMIKDGESWREVGAFWVKELRPREEEEAHDFV